MQILIAVNLKYYLYGFEDEDGETETERQRSVTYSLIL
jgi:hypothetical protein